MARGPRRHMKAARAEPRPEEIRLSPVRSVSPMRGAGADQAAAPLGLPAIPSAAAKQRAPSPPSSGPTVVAR